MQQLCVPRCLGSTPSSDLLCNSHCFFSWEYLCNLALLLDCCPLSLSLSLSLPLSLLPLPPTHLTRMPSLWIFIRTVLLLQGHQNQPNLSSIGFSPPPNAPLNPTSTLNPTPIPTDSGSVEGRWRHAVLQCMWGMLQRLSRLGPSDGTQAVFGG